jgi:Ca2+-binding EF-hand superfamily protein
MKQWRAAVLLACSSLTLPARADAQDDDRSFRSRTDCFSEQDADGNGRVTLLEARAAALVMFEYFDGNADGQVTTSEARGAALSWREGRAEDRFASLDRDRDGALSAWEIKLPPRRFVRADRDGDRRISRAELWALSEQRWDGTVDTAALRSLFWRRDLNGDGRVTRGEALAAADRRFRRKDIDRDGVWTRDEAQGPVSGRR